MSWEAHIRSHYEQSWDAAGDACRPAKGRSGDLPTDFAVLEFAPRPERRMWTYATCGMSQQQDPRPVELHLFSPRQADELVELLYAVAHYHRTGCALDLHHSVNFGRPWLDGSHCDHGFISLPYLDGPALERLGAGPAHVRFYWLIPITPSEVRLKKRLGVDALEERFERLGFDYLNPKRSPVA